MIFLFPVDSTTKWNTLSKIHRLIALDENRRLNRKLERFREFYLLLALLDEN
jgi:hypothetical protein